MRIRIFGITGSGKTYLGKKLSKKLGITHYEMDHVVFFAPDDTNYTKKNDETTRIKKLKEILKKKDWVLEGGYTSPWARSSFEKADITIVLKIPLYKRLWRIYTRKEHKKQSLKGLWGLTKMSFATRRRHKIVEQWSDKTLVFTSSDKALEQINKEKIRKLI